MGTGAVTVRQSGPEAGKGREANNGGFLSTLDRHIVRHQATISIVTGILAVLGVGAMVVGLSGVSPLLRVLRPF
jgi:hypothetical protein